MSRRTIAKGVDSGRAGEKRQPGMTTTGSGWEKAKLGDKLGDDYRARLDWWRAEEKRQPGMTDRRNAALHAATAYRVY